MGTLCYGGSISLDGYLADADGDFGWYVPSEDVFASHVDRMAEVSTEVLGRNTYALMRYWETEPDEGWTGPEKEFARRWRDIDKVVASSTLTHADLGSDHDRLVADLGLDELREIVGAATGLVEIFGPTVAAAAIRAGLVTDFRFYVVPVLVGGGLRALPDGIRLDLRLVEHRTFDDGVAYLRYVPR
ncbi:dihydrofolate reductase family protein [Gordonia sp. NPDC003376]